MERRHAEACRSHGIERAGSDAQKDCTHDHEAGRRILRRQTYRSARHVPTVDAVRMHDRNRESRQEQRRDSLVCNDGSIRWCVGRAAEFRWAFAAGVRFALAAGALGHRGAREDRAGAGQRHRQDEDQDRDNGSETPHGVSIAGPLQESPPIAAGDG